MCDFKPGDEVVCVDASLQWGVDPCPLIEGKTYTILEVEPNAPTVDGSAAVLIEVRSNHCAGTWRSSRFRKVQRRNSSLTIEAFFTVPGGFEEPKRAPAKTRERA